MGKIHLFGAFRGDREIGHRDIAVARFQCRKKLIPGYRHEYHIDFQRPGVQLAVDELFEGRERLVGEPALYRAVEEVEGLAVGHQRTNGAVLSHGGEIAAVSTRDQVEIIERVAVSICGRWSGCGGCSVACSIFGLRRRRGIIRPLIRHADANQNQRQEKDECVANLAHGVVNDLPGK